ncbi:MAG: DUF4382 domain-containing protein [Thermoplasmatota archaeon]
MKRFPMTHASTRPTPNRMTIAALALMAGAALAGCFYQPGAAAMGTLFVKDAPLDGAKAVDVTFTLAQVQSDNGTWRTVFDGKQTIDLLAFSNATAKAALANFTLPPGHYEAMRIAVSEVHVVLPNGTDELLNVFGNVVTVAHNFTVSTAGIQILVDFDLLKGVNLAAGTFTPVVKSVADANRGEDMSEARRDAAPRQSARNETDIPELRDRQSHDNQGRGEEGRGPGRQGQDGRENETRTGGGDGNATSQGRGDANETENATDEGGGRTNETGSEASSSPAPQGSSDGGDGSRADGRHG